MLRQIAQLAVQLAIQTVGDGSATQYMDVFEHNVKTLVSSHSVEECFKTENLTYCTFMKISHFDLNSVNLGDFSSFLFLFLFFLLKYNVGYLHTILGL